MTPEEIMTTESIEFNKFENVKEPRSKRPDLHAFVILSELEDDESGVLMRDVFTRGVGGAWLSFDPDIVFPKMTAEQAMDLVRCGITYDPDYPGFLSSVFDGIGWRKMQ